MDVEMQLRCLNGRRGGICGDRSGLGVGGMIQSEGGKAFAICSPAFCVTSKQQTIFARGLCPLGGLTPCKNHVHNCQYDLEKNTPG